VRQREGQEQGDVLARSDIAARSFVQIAAMQKRIQVQQFGSVLLNWSPADDDHPEKDITLEARDVHNGKVLWSRSYPHQHPHIDGAADSDTVVFSWDLSAKGAKEELKGDDEAKRLVDSLKDTAGGYLVEIVDLRSGNSLGKFPIGTGQLSFRALHFLTSGNTLAMIDSSNRATLFSAKGEKIGRAFGGEAALSHDGHRLCIEREPGRLALYNLPSLLPMDEMTFPNRLSYFSFTADNQHLVVLTADQMVYVLALEPAVQSVIQRTTQ
jgi:hypothetical protein